MVKNITTLCVFSGNTNSTAVQNIIIKAGH